MALYELRAVDAWTDETGDWNWNDSRVVQDSVEIPDLLDDDLLVWLVEQGHLKTECLGTCYVESFGERSFEVRDSATDEPFFAALELGE